MQDINISSAMPDELRMFTGLKLSVADFGTGYSSLSYLRLFQLGTLKIDRAFVRNVATGPDDGAIASSIIGLAHDLRLRVNTEDVETEEQLAYLREHGCDLLQGYYFSQPLSAEDLGEAAAERLGAGLARTGGAFVVRGPVARKRRPVPDSGEGVSGAAV